jgi:GTPase SAR1 family protein
LLNPSLQVPVILCGNKIDKRGGEVTNLDLEREIMPIMNEFKVRQSIPDDTDALYADPC